MHLVNRLWKDEAGFVVSAELVLVASIAVLGMIVGLATARDAVTSELADVGAAINELSQSYSISGIQGHSAAVNSWQFQDNKDYCDSGDDTANVDEQCIVHITPVGANEQDPATQGSKPNT